MATIVRGKSDNYVDAIKQALDAYERAYPGAAASLYRQNSASIRVRIVDDHFAGMSKPARHDEVWDFLSGRLSDDVLQEISLLLPIVPAEQSSSLANLEFDDPIPSQP